jgi:DNA-binding transcriptional regulator YbjK
MTFVDARSDNKNRLISSCMRLFELMKDTFVAVTEANKKMQSIAYGFLKTVCITHDMISALSQKQMLNQKRVEREKVLNQKRVEREHILSQKRVEREQKKADKAQIKADKLLAKELKNKSESNVKGTSTKGVVIDVTEE